MQRAKNSRSRPGRTALLVAALALPLASCAEFVTTLQAASHAYLEVQRQREPVESFAPDAPAAPDLDALLAEIPRTENR